MNKVKQKLNILGFYITFPKRDESNLAHASKNQTASDLGFSSASRLIEDLSIPKNEISSIIYLGSSPDYRSPATACVLQGRLDLPTDCVAFDVNIGSTGFAHALTLGLGLLQVKSNSYSLLVIGDTPSKWVDPQSSSFSSVVDASTVICVSHSNNTLSTLSLDQFVYSSASNDYGIKEGGFRYSGSEKSVDFLYHSASKYGFLNLDSTSFKKERESIALESLEVFFKTVDKPAEIDLWLLDYSLEGVGKWLIDKGVSESRIIQSEKNLFGSTIPNLLIDPINRNKKLSYLNVVTAEVGLGMTVSIMNISLNISKGIKTDRMESDHVFELGEVDHQM